MAEIVQGAQQEFWRPPSVLEPAAEAIPSAENWDTATACGSCGSEFMIGSRFCHTCGRRRAAVTKELSDARADAAIMAGLWLGSVERVRAGVSWTVTTVRRVPFPLWVRYLHFHEIKRWVGLPTAALVAFIVGLGCVAGAVGVSLFYKASNLAEFQAIQLWRIEWLLAATAAFVAGILLKKPSAD